MKKIVAIVVVIMALLIGSFSFWLSQPSLKGEEQVNESVANARNRFAQAQREAENIEVNGYLSEEFLPLWKAGGDGGTAAPVKQTVTGWAAFSNKSGTTTDHQALLAGGDKDYLAKRAAFEALIPGLTQSMSRRLFVVPRSNASSYQSPDSSGLRLLSQAVYSYVESKVAESQPGKAVPPLAALFSLGGQLQGRDPLVSDLMGISLQRIAFLALGLFGTDSSLTEGDWLTLGAAVHQAIPPADQMTRAMEAEISLGLGHIEQNEEIAKESGSFLDRKFLAREKRIFMNQTAQQLSALKEGKLADFQDPESGFGASLKGETGSIATVRTSDFVRAAKIMEFHRRAMILTASALDLKAYQAKNGKLPDSLDKLTEMGLPAPAEPVNYDPANKTVSIEIPSNVLESVDGKDYSVAGWSEMTEKGLQISL